MLLILMYHRAVEGRYGNPASVLRSHFQYLRERYAIVVPGENLKPGQLSLCLTFDDAYVDFYAYVFPLLREFSLRAVLAVPTGFILPRTDLSLQERLSVPAEQAMQQDNFRAKVPFCTWEEIREMTGSGLVEAASHSHRHVDLTRPGVDLESETLQSKGLLEQHLGRSISTLVYPFGRVNARAHSFARRHYVFAMRIGAAVNTNWRPARQPLCRVGADRLPNITRLLRWDRLAGYRLKGLVNGLRSALGKWQER